MGNLDAHRRDCHRRMAIRYNGADMYCNMTWDNVMCWENTPAGDIAIQECPDYVNGLSRAGFATRECQVNGTWKPNYEYNATDGWTNYTSCMGYDKPSINVSVHLARIQTMSEVGYGISLAFLIVAVTIMFFSKRLHCKSNSLHVNLFIAFILRAGVSFLKSALFVEDVGLEKDIIRKPGGAIRFIQEGTHWECKLLVTIFLYTVAASLMWIFMEGLYLHMLVYRTLFTERHGIRLYVVLGWVSPLIFIIPWILVRIFLENEICWNLNKHDGYFWIIKTPIILTVVINFIFFIDIVRVLCLRVKIRSQAQGSTKQFRRLAKFALVLIPLFGVIYIVFAAYPQGLNVEADIMYLYAEMFYNSFQGFVLALLFCFLNEEVHNEIRRCWCRRRLGGLNTRTVFLSSFRKSTNVSRATSPRDHVTGNIVKRGKLSNDKMVDVNGQNEQRKGMNDKRQKRNRAYMEIDNSEATMTASEV